MNDSEILLIGYLATNSFNGNYHKASKISQMMKLVKKNRLFKIYTIFFYKLFSHVITNNYLLLLTELVTIQSKKD